MFLRSVSGVLLISLLSGCATVPKESVELSTELTKMIRSAEASHLALVEDYISEKKHRADDFLERVWIPTFISKGMKDTKILDSIGVEKDPGRKGALLKEFCAELKNQKPRYVRVHAKNVGRCPEWHKGKGEKAWLFVDEISIQNSK